jgi:hypothetical protein
VTPEGWLRALPPFIVGGVLCIAALVAAGLLLYGGPGFLPALVVVLACHLAAIGAGIVWGRGVPAEDPVEFLRRRWFLFLVALTLAAVFAGSWEWFQGFGARALTQGLGLAFLSALPLFAGGAVLGSMTELPEPPTGLQAPAPAAFMGGATGALIFGLTLFPLFQSSTGLLLLCLVLVSMAALVHGRALDQLVWIRELASPAELASGARIEAWTRAVPERSTLVLLEEGRVRCAVGRDGVATLSVDRALNDGVGRWAPRGGRALILGVGRLPLAVRLVAGDSLPGGSRWQVLLLEKDRTLLTLLEEEGGPKLPVPLVEGGAAGDEDLEGGDGPGDEACSSSFRFRPLSVQEALGDEDPEGVLGLERYDLIAVDTLALGGGSAPVGMPGAVVERLGRALRPGGVLLVGPLQDGGSRGSLLVGAREVARQLDRVSIYVAGKTLPAREDGVPAARTDAWTRSQAEIGARPAFLVAGGRERTHWPDRVGGYLRVVVEPESRPVRTEVE